MKVIYILAFILVAVLFSETTHAQTNYAFTYDASGNRLTRVVIFLKRATIQDDSLQAKQASQILEDEVGLQKTRIFPNPTNSTVNVEFPGLMESGVIISVFDSSGRMIIHKTGNNVGNEINLSNYPTGSYIMTIHAGQVKKEWKVIKE